MTQSKHCPVCSPLNVLRTEALAHLAVLGPRCEWHLDPDHLPGVRADHAPPRPPVVPDRLHAPVAVHIGQDVAEVWRLPEIVRGSRLVVLLVAAVEDARGPRGVQPRARPARHPAGPALRPPARLLHGG